MTPQEQLKDDNVLLDYTRWADARRMAKLSTDHTKWLEVRENVLARQRSDNQQARAAYDAKLAAERKARADAGDAKIEQELAPQKQRLMRDWLANNPSLTEADFEAKAWQHLRTNLIEQSNDEAIRNQIAQNIANAGQNSL